MITWSKYAGDGIGGLYTTGSTYFGYAGAGGVYAGAGSIGPLNAGAGGVYAGTGAGGKGALNAGAGGVYG